jgi:hypothetical protein
MGSGTTTTGIGIITITTAGIIIIDCANPPSRRA